MRKFICFAVFLWPMLLVAQEISGTVMSQSEEYLVGANVYWMNTNTGTITSSNGNFKISLTDKSNGYLVASYVGFESDTIEYKGQDRIVFYLNPSQTLDEVVLTERKDGVFISSLKAQKTETITEAELVKAACCDLAGCFDTQLTVQPQTTNVITNSKELRILGLSGVYNQVLIDGLPMTQGLSYTYGISSVPGTLVENIFISKGANSVLQGFESISGQINVITKSPAKTDKLLLNIYANSFGESQYNANYAFGEGKWKNMLTFHSVQPSGRIDGDEDEFLDLPLLTRYSITNKISYGNESDWGWNSKIGIRYMNEERIGGQVDFDKSEDQGSNQVYGQTVNIDQSDFWSKSSFRYDDVRTLSIFASGFYQDQNSFFGTTSYNAQQTNLFGKIQYELNFKQNNLKAGLSYRFLELDEQLAFTDNSLDRSFDGDYERKESIPGIFAENSFRALQNRLTWILGVRADHHNEFGWKITPRTLVKYDLNQNSVVRANVGLGWRTVNLFSENVGLLVSSRDIIFNEVLEPEKALNYGINYTQKLDENMENISGYFSFDFYRTQFQNQIFPDYNSDPQKAIIQNFEGKSISNGFQAELNLKFYDIVEFKTGYNYLDVYRMIGEDKEVLPFNPKHKVFSTFSFKPLNNKYHFDVNIHWFGMQVLPNTESNPEEFQIPEFSDPYTTVNTQFSYYLDKVEFYVGCENIFGFRQNRPILSWEDPFSQYFDTSSVWGPTRGREFYLGVRYRVKE